MEPSDAKSIAESLIHQAAKDTSSMGVSWTLENLHLSFQEEMDLWDDVEYLIENAKITVEFPEG